jgi:hypothetical protein
VGSRGKACGVAMAWFLTGWGERCRRPVGWLGGEPGHFKECGQRRGECLPVVRVELAGQGGQATDALLSPRLDHLGTGGR